MSFILFLLNNWTIYLVLFALNFFGRENVMRYSATLFHGNALARIFHTHRDEEVAKLDETRQMSIGTQGCIGSYCLSLHGSLTTYSSSCPASAVDRYEISGLAPVRFALHSA